MSFSFKNLFMPCQNFIKYLKQQIFWIYNLILIHKKKSNLTEAEENTNLKISTETKIRFKKIPTREERKAVDEIYKSFLETENNQKFGKPSFRFTYTNPITLNNIRKNCDIRVRYGSKGFTKFVRTFIYYPRSSGVRERRIPLQIWQYLFTLFRREENKIDFMIEGSDQEQVDHLVALCFKNTSPELKEMSSSTIFSAIKVFLRYYLGSLIPPEFQDILKIVYYKDTLSFLRRIEHIPYSLREERTALLIQIFQLIRSIFLRDITGNTQVLPSVIKELGLVFYGRMDPEEDSDIIFIVMCELIKKDWDSIPEYIVLYKNLCSRL